MIQIAERLQQVEEYYFSKKLQEIAMLNTEGKKIINLGIGSPDLAPHHTVIDTLYQYAQLPNTHAYQSYKGLPELRKAISDWYLKFYKVALHAQTEILPLMGSKEGIVHICMTYLNPGDIALVPNPGYPTYASAVNLTGAQIKYYDLIEQENWQPNLETIAQSVDLDKVKIMFVNYPHMPTGTAGSDALFDTLISFAKAHNILIVNDNPYSFLGTNQPLSILSNPNAKDVAIELNSLSKSLNMAGWRIGMLCGNETHIQNVLRFKSNMDSGMFLPLQMAATKALNLDHYWYKQLNTTYNQRKQIVFDMLTQMGCTFQPNQQGLFVWAKIDSKKYASGYELSDDVLYNKNIFITPGGIFGSNGNAYIRISLCQPESILKEALNRITL